MGWPLGRAAHNRVSLALENEVVALYQKGHSFAEIGRRLRLGNGTLDRIKRRRNLNPRSRAAAMKLYYERMVGRGRLERPDRLGEDRPQVLFR